MSAIVKDLTQGKISTHLYRLALPIMGTSFVQMAYSFTDMAWLGRLGTESIAAVGTISVFLWIAASISALNKTAGEVTIARAIGNKSIPEARAFASHNTTMSLLIGLAVALIYALFAPELVDLYHLNSFVRSTALDYMYITLLGIPFIYLSYTLFGVYNAIGQSKIPFRVLAMGLISNMLLDPLFIHAFGWGVKGAAWATVVSEVFVFFVFLYRLRKTDRLLDNFPIFTRLSWAISYRILYIGVPAAGLNVLFALISIYMGRLATVIGGSTGIAVLTTGGQIEALTWNTSQGATTALSTIVAQNHAAGQYQRVKEAYRDTLIFTLSLGLVGMLLFVCAGEQIFSLIVPEVQTANEGGLYMRISGYSQILMMLELSTQGLFYGMGLSMIPAGISISGNLLRIPLALWFISMGLGLSSIWWAISISAGLKGIVAFLVFLYMRKRLLGKDPSTNLSANQ